MKTRIKFFLITGVFSLLVSCTGKEKVQQTMSDEDLNLILTEAQSSLIKEDFVRAAVLFQKAAEQGNATGELYWGLLYFAGAGVDKDLSKAARLWKRALKHPSFDIPEETGKFFEGLFFELGNAYNNGEGVRKKKSEAVFWYRKAAECGVPLAQYKLGICYALGEGVKKDKNTALYWLEEATGSYELDKTYNIFAKEMIMALRQLGASSSEVKVDGNPFMGKVSKNTSAKEMDAVFDTSTQTLTITGKGDMIDYDDSIPPWESYEEEIVNLVIEEGITKVGNNSFEDYEGIISIKLPNSLKSIGDDAFNGTGISTVDLPDSLESIGMGAFYDTKLTSVFIPASVKDIEPLTFSCRVDVADDNPYFSSLDGILFDKKKERLLIYPKNKPGDYEVPNTVKEISEGAFYRSNLTSMKIPVSVKKIGVFAFRLTELNEVTVSWDKPLVFTGEIPSLGDVSKCTLYVPKGTKNAYQEAKEWSEFGSIKEY